jgi:hypothetical protein
MDMVLRTDSLVREKKSPLWKKKIPNNPELALTSIVSSEKREASVN